jgi:hypothetical protein
MTPLASVHKSITQGAVADAAFTSNAMMQRERVTLVLVSDFQGNTVKAYNCRLFILRAWDFKNMNQGIAEQTRIRAGVMRSK